ncbi:MAG: photosynthetic reaction center cytochrome PufC [Rhodobacteraceae bacterium]|nr:photosynthetic reaction center cytochrome PufC [Paracoccaceae bacterium]
MFRKPDWYEEWAKANPIRSSGPLVLLCTVGVAIIVAVGIILMANPWQTSTLQTGPRGLALGVIKIDANRTEDPTIAGYSSSEPIIPTGGEVLARDAYENAEESLGHLTKDNYDRLVTAMRSWTGIEDLFAGEENYQTVVARMMIQMTQNINEGYEEHVGGAGVNCYTCHRGQPVPSGIWFNNVPVNSNVSGWAAAQNRATMNSEYTSLPSDALEKYLNDYNVIRVHDLESRVDNEGTATIQDTERTYSLMNHFSNSLNVNCTFCHNTRAFYDLEQSAPQLNQAQLAIGMIQEINLDYLTQIEDVLPPHRLGPMHGDVPKVACLTCHKGYSKPLNGLDMVSDWPELTTTDDEVVYE